MKKREEVVAFIKYQLNTTDYEESKRNAFHYGRQELKSLLDFIYGGEPKKDSERLAR